MTDAQWGRKGGVTGAISATRVYPNSYRAGGRRRRAVEPRLWRAPVATVILPLHLRLPLSAAHPLCEFINHFVAIEGETDEERWVDYS